MLYCVLFPYSPRHDTVNVVLCIVSLQPQTCHRECCIVYCHLTAPDLPSYHRPSFPSPSAPLSPASAMPPSSFSGRGRMGSQLHSPGSHLPKVSEVGTHCLTVLTLTNSQCEHIKQCREQTIYIHSIEKCSLIDLCY
jgi:hypothetical protein